MKRLAVFAGATVISAIWWLLSQSLSLGITTFTYGVFAALGPVESPRKALRDVSFVSLWAAVVSLYMRIQWGRTW